LLEHLLDRRERQLVLIALVQVLAMSVWFSASAVVSALRDDWGISSQQEGLLTAAVQLGFVVGALLSAACNLPDIVAQPRLIAVSAALGAAATAALAIWSHGLASALPLRFGTGFALAGVYPVSMRLMASWFERARGWALGVLVGALTVGSALPQLVNGLTALPWRGVLLAASALALVAAVLALVVLRVGPYMKPAPPFAPGYIVRMFRDRPQRLVNLGYLGHMWELYAVWTWLPAFLAASLAASGTASPSRTIVGLTLFCSIGVAGCFGCLLAGRLADRLGRARVAMGALIISGCCCLLAGVAFGSSLVVLVPLLVVWGGAIIADSAQFSAALTEFADPRYVGTALTAQTALGFLLTVLTIQALPVSVDAIGWRASIALLALGPVVGIAAMARLRQTQGRRVVNGRPAGDSTYERTEAP
jgi:MFS family permease